MARMHRREFITLLGGAAIVLPRPAAGQQHFTIGLLNTGASTVFVGPFMAKLEELGYREGKNVVLDRRFAEGSTERLNEFAADLVRKRVDVIVTLGTPAAFAAKKATSTIPIVLGAISDPVGVGVVASLARPGGNATGNSLMAPELSAKRLEILRALAPGISRFAILWDSSNPGMAARVHETKIAADQSHVFLHVVGPRNIDELEAAFTELLNLHPDALLVTTETFTRQHLARILDFANRNKIPAMFEDSSYVDAGGLMSYGPDYQEVFRTAAVFVDKILKGAKPADLPIQQPTKFQLVINLRTATALGIEIPPTLLTMADRVIE
ncbi:MAG TPA: ABC transporter substrate-binding protein [Bradyrhizobium sp.]|uniref:ABC transporter substrate-binding protein n=1 Tax=Bradyrhizobium sp. TaxID=376 RepID=UPI002B4A8458|nr:ABC transporter substrate-binding protein [Bradyrhizobium sp.]HKO71859.1 ABC transporter substrate-binding protein [Bradyrhizobium sp.]